MGKVIVMNWVTLDGVMQGPGRSDEDTRDGFPHGGWAEGYSDQLAGRKMGERMGSDFAWLFGRRTYEDLLSAWNAKGGPFKDALNDRRKFVASAEPEASLGWPNSTLLSGNVPASVADLRGSSDGNLVIMGSSVLIASLMPAGLIDEYLLMIAPIVLGEGRRLFPDGISASLRLLECSPTSTGALVASYAPVA
jgi:dihydrofolate reductase